LRIAPRSDKFISIAENQYKIHKLNENAASITGLVLTKMDGTAKGGSVFAIRDLLNIPVKYIGVGEQIDDMRPFDPDDFVRALFAKGND
ncbi:MAG: signal recognition particle-docking protein FtsY, partial [Clostridia bacterium]|nr:signal recognition particle-docking protein FtsY [Clostridia bacterium]